MQLKSTLELGTNTHLLHVQLWQIESGLLKFAISMHLNPTLTRLTHTMIMKWVDEVLTGIWR